jgi:hypothetical protein
VLHGRWLDVTHIPPFPPIDGVEEARVDGGEAGNLLPPLVLQEAKLLSVPPPRLGSSVTKATIVSGSTR